MINLNLLDLISQEEYEMMFRYRSYYAFPDDCTIRKEREIPIRDILNVWNENKQTLFELFGNKLIISKPFEYTKSTQELMDELGKMTSTAYGRAERECYTFILNYETWIDSVYGKYTNYHYDLPPFGNKVYDPEKVEIKRSLYNLTSLKVLAENKYNGESFAINLPNGKEYVISKGCKPMRAISKIASAFNIEGFEDFRICHSQVHNQKKIKGNIVLSIHPLDYWTMSDNSSDWSSCMSWEDNGCYKQGTVEMMNANNVIVAYIEGSNKFTIADKDWNNKKWRQLFVVDENFILGVKAYPYENANISDCIINWLKELGETNMGWKYANDEAISFKSHESFINPKYPKVTIRGDFYTDNMYNDVVASAYHPLYFSKELGKESDRDNIDSFYFSYPYSGPSQCVCCGMEFPDLYSEGSLTCSSCGELSICDECGDIVDELYEIGGYHYCSSCYDSLVSSCPLCEEDAFNDEFVEMKVLVEIPKKICQENSTYHSLYGSLYKAVYQLPFTFRLCDKCWDYVQSKYLKDGAEAHFYKEAGHIWQEYGYIWLKDFRRIKDFDNLVTEYCGEEFDIKQLLSTKYFGYEDAKKLSMSNNYLFIKE